MNQQHARLGSVALFAPEKRGKKLSTEADITFYKRIYAYPAGITYGSSGAQRLVANRCDVVLNANILSGSKRGLCEDD